MYIVMKSTNLSKCSRGVGRVRVKIEGDLL